MRFPFGNTEKEHNDFCDSMKCRHGNYCNPIIGLCPKCIMEKGSNEQKQHLKNSSELCKGGCGRIIGIYDKEYTHNYSNRFGSTCNICHNHSEKVGVGKVLGTGTSQDSAPISEKFNKNDIL